MSFSKLNIEVEFGVVNENQYIACMVKLNKDPLWIEDCVENNEDYLVKKIKSDNALKQKVENHFQIKL